MSGYERFDVYRFLGFYGFLVYNWDFSINIERLYLLNICCYFLLGLFRRFCFFRKMIFFILLIVMLMKYEWK